MADPSSTRAPRRTVVGTVVSDKMDRTIAVRVAHKVRHPKYGKYVARHEIFKAHDPEGKAALGDTVEISFARRISKTKHWRLVRIVSAARVVAVRGDEEVQALPGKQAPVAPVAPAAPEAPAPAPEVSS